MKLNLGCGKDIREGYINIDRFPGNGVDIVCDLNDGLPFKNEQFDMVYASHILEHVIDIHNVVQEIYRVMKPEGILEIKVPYRFTSLDIGHHHFFATSSMDAFYLDESSKSLEHKKLFNLLSRNYAYGWPFRWHINKYILSRIGLELPKSTRFGLFRNEIHWIMRKVI